MWMSVENFTVIPSTTVMTYFTPNYSTLNQSHGNSKWQDLKSFFWYVYSKTSVETFSAGFHCTMELELAKPVGLISYLIIVADVQNTSIWKMFVHVYVYPPRTSEYHDMCSDMRWPLTKWMSVTSFLPLGVSTYQTMWAWSHYEK